MLEMISQAFRGIWSHKLRSLLTMLGIVIGIAAIITIVSTIKGTNEQIKENLIGSGNNVVNINLSADGTSLLLEYESLPEGVSVISEEEMDTVRSLEHVLDATAYRSRTYAGDTYYKNTAYSGSLYGIDAHYFSTNCYKLVGGRDFVPSDFSSFRKVVIIEQHVTGELFEGEDPIGKTLEIGTEPFTVIGVVQKSVRQKPTIETYEDYYTYMSDSGSKIFIPSQCWDIIYRYDEPQNVSVRTDSTDYMTSAGKAAADELTGAVITNKNYKYLADDLLEQAAELQSLSSSTNSQLIWIAGISLLVGGIGVMNIMLVSVTERTKEIGLKMAIGANAGSIRLQFLTEAAVLTLFGGILGVFAGIGLAQLLSHIMGIAVAISVPACSIAVVFSMLMGIVFGLAPAFKASRLNPIEALNRE